MEEFDSDLDPQTVLQNQLDQLQELNSRLKKENSQLKAQFDQAIVLTSEIESLSQKNNKMDEIIRKYKAEKSELEQRIEVLANTNRTLESQLTAERQDHIEARKLSQTSADLQIAKAKKDTKTEIEKLTKQLETVQSEKEEIISQGKALEYDVQRLLASAKFHFDTQFSSIKELSAFLDRSNKVNTPPKVIYKTKKQPKHCAEIDIGLEKENLDLQGEVARLKRKIRLLESAHASAIDEINRKHQLQQDEHFYADRDKTNKIESLEKEVLKLKERLAEESARVERARAPVSTPEPVIKCIRNTEEVEALELRIADLSGQLLVLQEKFNAQVQRADKMKHDNDDLRQTREQLQRKFTVLKTTDHAKAEKIKSLRSELNSKEQEIHHLQKHKCENESLKCQMTQMIANIESQGQQIQDLLREREENRKQLSDKEVANIQLTRDLTAVKSSLDDMQIEFSLTKKELAVKSNMKIDDVIPVGYLKSEIFDMALTDEINRVADTRGLLFITKVQNIYREIQKYYTTKLNESETARTAIENEYQVLKQAVTQFILSVATALSVKAPSLNEFVAPGGYNALITSMNDLKTSLEQNQHTSNLLMSFVKHFQESFKLEQTQDVTKTLPQINDLATQFSAQSRAIAKRDKQHKQMKRTCEKLENSLTDAQRSFEEKSMSMKRQLDEYEAQIHEMENALHRKKRQTSALKEELKECRRTQLETEAAMQVQHDQLVQERTRIENDLHERLSAMTTKANRFENAAQTAESNVSSLKKQLRKQRAVIEEKDIQIGKMKSAYGEHEHTTLQRLKEEKESLVKTYETTISQLKEQCSSMRKEFSGKLHISQKECAHARSNMAALKTENDRLTQELTTKTDEVDRAKKLADAQIKSQVASLESDFTTRMDSYKAQWESEKRKLFSFVADQFRQFFDPQMSFSEESFKAVVMKARDEMNKLLENDAAIRRLVGAQPQQRTDEAVAKVIMS